MTSRLSPCPSCTRHVKVGSSACPFCGGDVPIDVPARPMPSTRPLTRAAIMFASVAAVSAAACSSSTTTSGDKDAEADAPLGPPDGALHASYGVAVMPPDAGQGSGSGSQGEPEGGLMAAYGVGVLPDSGPGQR